MPQGRWLTLVAFAVAPHVRARKLRPTSGGGPSQVVVRHEVGRGARDRAEVGRCADHLSSAARLRGGRSADLSQQVRSTQTSRSTSVSGTGHGSLSSDGTQAVLNGPPSRPYSRHLPHGLRQPMGMTWTLSSRRPPAPVLVMTPRHAGSRCREESTLALKRSSACRS